MGRLGSKPAKLVERGFEAGEVSLMTAASRPISSFWWRPEDRSRNRSAVAALNLLRSAISRGLGLFLETALAVLERAANRFLDIRIGRFEHVFPESVF